MDLKTIPRVFHQFSSSCLQQKPCRAGVPVIEVEVRVGEPGPFPENSSLEFSFVQKMGPVSLKKPLDSAACPVSESLF